MIMDVDVKGALNIKKQFGEEALALFIMPPDISCLESRLRARGTDAPEVIERRISKAEYEISFAPRFDKVVINDDLETAVEEVRCRILEFAGSKK